MRSITFLQVEEQADRLERLEMQATSAQLAMLRYQLNPHFLFNTLNSISTLVLLQQTRPANAMLTRLSSFLRHTLITQPGGKVTVAQEVETLQLYLEIERMRFEERLRTSFQIDDAATSARLPSMLLQPLVENAIKYAVSPQEEGAQITLAAQIVAERLRITVSDTGPGVPPDKTAAADGDDADLPDFVGTAGQDRIHRSRPGQYPRPSGASLWRRTPLRNTHSWAGRIYRRDRNTGGNRTCGSGRPRNRRQCDAFGGQQCGKRREHRSPRLRPKRGQKRGQQTIDRIASMTISTIIVDDEKLAIQGLQLRLQPFEDVEIIETCANGRDAIRKIKTLKPDLVFLDIQMPGFDGFSVVKGVMELEPPLFVFVTAFQEHAVRAFEANAVNYLMKPVDEDKLADTLDRVRERMAEKRSSEEVDKLRNVLSEVAPDAAEELAEGDGESTERFEKLINVKDRGQIFRVEVGSIEHIEAAGDYMCIYTGDNSLILRETMKDLERRLDPRTFQRVHRSTIVNLDQVRQVKPHTNGECFLVLDSGAEVKGVAQLPRCGGAVRALTC